MKHSTFHFYMKTKILVDFHIHISVRLKVFLQSNVNSRIDKQDLCYFTLLVQRVRGDIAIKSFYSSTPYGLEYEKAASVNYLQARNQKLFPGRAGFLKWEHLSVQVRIFPLNMCDIIIYVARWWEKHLSKRSLIKHTCSWRVNLLYYKHWTDKWK